MSLQLFPDNLNLLMYRAVRFSFSNKNNETIPLIDAQLLSPPACLPTYKNNKPDKELDKTYGLITNRYTYA
jgi:hypothetical protein